MLQLAAVIVKGRQKNTPFSIIFCKTVNDIVSFSKNNSNCHKNNVSVAEQQLFGMHHTHFLAITAQLQHENPSLHFFSTIL